MPTYYPDTNILIAFGKQPDVKEKLERARQDGTRFVVAPLALIELVRGMIKGGGVTFEQDRRVFIWLRDSGFEILLLPFPFMAKILGSPASGRSGVVPDHYRQEIEMVAGASDLHDFIVKAKGTVWRDIAHADPIHTAQLDKEIAALSILAKGGLKQNYAKKLSKQFGAPGYRPNPLIIGRTFSAALEFLERSIVKIRAGAKVRKNDSGLYVDFQLLFYLADPELRFLTNEKFSHEIRVSLQRFQIVNLDSLP